MRIKGGLAKGLVAAFVFTLVPVVAFSAQKITPGSTCKVLNQKVIYLTKTYSCIKSGKKLVWNKGVVIIKPSPTTTPVAIGDPLGAIGGIPTPTLSPKVVVLPPEPKTFDDLITHPESIPYWAWEKSRQQVVSSIAIGPKATAIVGPHTVLPNTALQTAINLAAKLYDGFVHPSSVIAIYYNFEDIAWAQQEWAKVSLHPRGGEAARQCQSPSTCWGAMAEVDLKGNGILFMAVPSVPDGNHSSGTLEAHEYSHAIQGSQFVGTAKEANSYCCTKTYLPWWMVEGNAEFTQAAATYSTSYTNYLKERKVDTNELLANSAKTFTREWFQNYLDTSKTSEWNKPENNWRMYDVGYLVNEALASLKGPDINMQLFKDVANGKTWEQAFEANLGIAWSDALPKLAAILYAMVGR